MVDSLRTTVFTFDAGGHVGKKIVATSLETGVSSAAGRRLSLAAVQAAASSAGAAPATPMVEKTVVVPVYPAPQPAVAAAVASGTAAGASAASSEVTVISPIAEGQNPPPPTAAQSRRISFVVQEDVAAAAQVSCWFPIHYV